MPLHLLQDAIAYYSSLSATTFFTAVAIAMAFSFITSALFGSSHNPTRIERQPHVPLVQMGEMTEEELKDYDGSYPDKPLLMAIKGQIYDVSQSRMFYGPSGQYGLFAGKDASRALAKMSFEEKDLTGDITGLSAFELEALEDWEDKFMGKYVKVGTIKNYLSNSEPSVENVATTNIAEAENIAETKSIAAADEK